MKLEEQWAYLTYNFSLWSIIKRSQVRNSNRKGYWNQELMHRRWKDVAYWLTSHGLLSFFSYRMQNLHLEMAESISLPIDQ